MAPSAHAAPSYSLRLPEVHAGAMNSGKTVSLIVLTVLGALGTADAGRTWEDGTGAMWVAPELLAASANTWIACKSAMPLDDRISFDWLPATGELTFDAAISAVTLPEDSLPRASTLAARSCESR